jgi:hypothetical protein
MSRLVRFRLPRALRVAVLGGVLFGAALAVAARAAEAQIVTTGSGTATMTVIAPVAVVVTRGLDFGHSPASANGTYTQATSSYAGTFNITGEPNSTVNLSFTLPGSLTGPGTAIPLYGWELAFGPTTAFGTTSTPTGTPTPFTLSGAGGLYFGVGAKTNTLSGQALGHYSGTVSITVAYP